MGILDMDPVRESYLVINQSNNNMEGSSEGKMPSLTRPGGSGRLPDLSRPVELAVSPITQVIETGRVDSGDAVVEQADGGEAGGTQARSLRERAREMREEGRERSRQERQLRLQELRNRANGIINGLVGFAQDAGTTVGRIGREVGGHIVDTARDAGEVAQGIGRGAAEAARAVGRGAMEAARNVRDLPGRVDRALDVPVMYATNSEIRHEANRDLGQRIEAAASRFAERMGEIGTEIGREWHAENRRMGRVIEDIADDIATPVGALAERSGKAAARFGVGRLRDVALGVIDVWGFADRQISNARAGVDSMVGRRLQRIGNTNERRLTFPHEFVQGIVDGWKSYRSTEGVARRVEPVANFLRNCRQAADESWTQGARMTLAAAEIRSGLAGRETQREEIRGNVRRGADKARAELH